MREMDDENNVLCKVKIVEKDDMKGALNIT